MSDAKQIQRDGMRGQDAEETSKSEEVPGDGPDQTPPPPSWIVWTVRLVSLATLFGIIGFLLYLALRTEVPAQFDIDLEFGDAEQREGQWVLPVELVNSSTEAVNEVVLEVVQGDVTRSTTVALLGEGEMIEIEFRLPQEPSEGNTEANVLSYQSP